MQQTVKFKCGHEVEVDIMGRTDEAEQQIKVFGQIKCKTCRSESNPEPKGFVHMAKEPRTAPAKKPKDDDEEEPDLETEGQTSPPPKDEN